MEDVFEVLRGAENFFGVCGGSVVVGKAQG